VKKSLINRILMDREKRYNKILNLINEYKMAVVCGKINYPGNNKNTPEVKKAFTVLMKNLKNTYGKWLMHLEILIGNDGPALLMVIDRDVFEAKELALSVEGEEGIGRIFDIDIYKVDGSSVSRAEINLEPRRCFLCHDDGRICTRLGKHRMDEVLGVVNNIIKDYGEAND
jgi:holo-ACP synthase